MPLAQSEAAPKRGRGRPKGSGKDDAIVLGHIRRLLEADSALKPTTAIKRAGVIDPSAVRRLRDKLRLEATTVSPATVVATSVSPTRARRRAVEAAIVAAPTRASALADRGPSGAAVEDVLQTVRADDRRPEAPAETEPSGPSERSPKLPPLPAQTEKRTRDALLLAAYLEALAKSTSQADGAGLARAPSVSEQTVAASPSHADAVLFPQAPLPQTPHRPEAPRPDAAPPLPEASSPPKAPFTFPGMPPFLQPFRPAAPPAQTSSGQQLEGLKLAVEAMTTMAKLQLHVTENAMAYSPLALMLQGQTFIGQMLLASFTGQLDALKQKK